MCVCAGQKFASIQGPRFEPKFEFCLVELHITALLVFDIYGLESCREVSPQASPWHSLMKT